MRPGDEGMATGCSNAKSVMSSNASRIFCVVIHLRKVISTHSIMVEYTCLSTRGPRFDPR